MQTKKIKKYSVLITLFILPLVTYLFFASAVHSFANLPTVHENALQQKDYINLVNNEAFSLNDKINVITFLGQDVKNQKAFAYNLKEKIYDKNKDFQDFQFVSIVGENQKQNVKDFIYEINLTSNAAKWKFIELPSIEAEQLIKQLTNSKLTLDSNYASNYAFIVDKKGNLRGRVDDKDYGEMLGYNIKSIADLNNKMVDDVKVILAEYRLELKKYKADRK